MANELKLDQIIVANWSHGQGQSLNSILYGLSEQGEVYKYVSALNKWEKLGMEVIEYE